MNLKLAKEEKKKLWQELSKANPNKFINSDGDIAGDPKKYRNSGRTDYLQLMKNDKYINCQRCMKYRSVLEYGCGNGRMTEFIAEDFKAVYAIDISPEMLKLGKERVKADNIFWMETDGSILPKVRVDYVFSYIVLQHLTKEIIEDIFKQFYAVMKPKAIAKIQIRGKPVQSGTWCYGEFYTMEEACELAQNTGFRIFKTQGEGERYFWLWMAKL